MRLLQQMGEGASAMDGWVCLPKKDVWLGASPKKGADRQVDPPQNGARPEFLSRINLFYPPSLGLSQASAGPTPMHNGRPDIEVDVDVRRSGRPTALLLGIVDLGFLLMRWMKHQ